MAKKNVINLGIISLLILFISASCNQQRSEADFREELADIREEKSEIVHQINEALNIADISEFKRQARNAIDNLDDQIDNYQDEMDRADRRIDREARDAIVSMKQKKTAIEFRLDLLEDRDDTGARRGMDEDRGTGDPAGTGYTSDGPERTDEVPQTDRIDDRPRTDQPDAATPRTDRPAGTQQPVERGAERPGQMTGPDRTGDMTGGPDRAYVDSGELTQYHQQIMEETRNELVELREEIQRFMERSL
jgi:TolA-binding protein